MTVAKIAPLGERQTEDLKIRGSIPESSFELCIILDLVNLFSSFFLFFFTNFLRTSFIFRAANILQTIKVQ